MKVWLKNNKGNPILVIAMAIPVNSIPGMAEKTKRILTEHTSAKESTFI